MNQLRSSTFLIPSKTEFSFQKTFLIPSKTEMEYFHILRIPYGSSDRDIRRAYKRLVLKYHPDKNNGNTTKFYEIKNAHDELLGLGEFSLLKSDGISKLHEIQKVTEEITKATEEMTKTTKEMRKTTQEILKNLKTLIEKI
jgi:hypothetical protein